MVTVVLTTATLALVLGLGIMIEFFGFYTKGSFVSPFIHFLGFAWFFVFGTQVAKWSSVISQLTTWAGSGFSSSTFPSQPFVLIFVFMAVISLAGMLESIGAIVFEHSGNAATKRGSQIISRRDSNRGL